MSRLIRALYATPWAMEPRSLAIVMSILERKMAGDTFTGPALHAELGIAMEAATRRTGPRDARLAVIPIAGVIEDHTMSLGTSARSIGAEFDAALASKQVDGILFDVNSPGGTVTGVPELADKIHDARGMKPTLAFVSGRAASAAYWLAASAKEVWMTQSSQAGSIGVFAIHADESQHLENDGVKVDVISAGKFKAESLPITPLTEEGREFIQAQVDEAYGWFVKSVAAGRGDSQANVRNGFGEGRTLGAVQAVKEGLADTVGTFEQAVARLVTMTGRRSTRSRAAIARARVALDTESRTS